METNEQWRDVHDCDGYEISNLGRLRSVIYRHRWGVKWRIHVLKPRYDRYGYLYAALGAGRYRKIHRLVAAAFIRNPDGKPQVNHSNGIKDDNRVENLEWVTNSENHKHAHRIGLCRPNAVKLKESQVRDIRRLLSDGARSCADIARSYGMSRHAISAIKTGETWSRLLT